MIFGVKVFYQQIADLWRGPGDPCSLSGLLLMKTRLGLAIRSTAQDREVANLMGMNESRVAMITMGISVGLAAFTGAVIAPLTIVNPFMWMHPLIMMMAVVVLGGMGSIKGSFVGGLYPGICRGPGGLFNPHGGFSQGFRGPVHHDPGALDQAGRSLWHCFRGREIDMGMIGFYLRKLFTIFKGRGARPSQPGCCSPFLFGSAPPAHGDPGSLPAAHPDLDQHFRHLRGQLGPPVRFYRPDEFRARPLLRRGGIHRRFVESSCPPAPLGKYSPRRAGRGAGRSDYRHSLPEAQRERTWP